jgi:hypothetical protein
VQNAPIYPAKRTGYKQQGTPDETGEKMAQRKSKPADETDDGTKQRREEATQP